jgi:hypothetical protein
MADKKYIWVPSLRKIEEIEKEEKDKIYLKNGNIIEESQGYFSFYDVFLNNKEIFEKIINEIENKKNNKNFQDLYLSLYNLSVKIITDKDLSEIAGTLHFLFNNKDLNEKETEKKLGIDISEEKEKIKSFLIEFLDSLFSKDNIRNILKTEKVRDIIKEISLYDIRYNRINFFFKNNDFLEYFKTKEKEVTNEIFNYFTENLFFNKDYLSKINKNVFFSLIDFFKLKDENIGYNDLADRLSKEHIAETFVFIRNLRKEYLKNEEFYNIDNDYLLHIENIFFSYLLNSWLKNKTKEEFNGIVNYIIDKINKASKEKNENRFKEIRKIFFSEEKEIEKLIQDIENLSEKEKTDKNPADYIFLLNGILSIGMFYKKITIDERLNFIDTSTSYFSLNLLIISINSSTS